MNIRDPKEFEGVRNERRVKHIHKKLRKSLLLVFVIVLGVVLLGYASYIRPLPTVSAQTTLPPVTTGQAVVTWPAQGQAAVGVQGQGVLASTEGQKPVPTASTTKLMVALAVLKKYPMGAGQTGQVITITQADVDRYNEYVAQQGSVVQMAVGQQVTQYQALQALLIPSANNVADALAIWAYGSMSAYHQAAGQIATDLSMTQTQFGGDAGGLSPKTVSTAHDLVLLGQAAMNEPVIKEIVGQKSFTLPVVGTITNTNILLGKDNIVGIKTGNTDEAGGCYVFAAEHTLPNGQKITAIGAVMGAPTLAQAFASAPPLLNSFYKGFAPTTVITKGQEVAHYNVPWGGQVPVVAAQDVSVVSWQSSKPTVTLTAKPLKAPQQQGAEVGSVTASTPYGKAQVPIVLAQPISQPTWQWRLVRR